MQPKDELPLYLNRAQLAFLTQKTPEQFVKRRPGPGGAILDYVEIGYVVNSKSGFWLGLGF